MGVAQADEERYKYLDQFAFEWRQGERVSKASSKEDTELVDRMLDAMRRYEISKGLHEDALKKPELTFDVALKQAELMGTKEKDIAKVISQLMMTDIVDKAGSLRIRVSFEFLGLLDMVNARKLIQPSEDKIRKLAECEETKTATEKQLHKAEERIIELEKLVRLLHGDPTPKKDTLRGDVGEGGDSNEHS